MDQILGLMVTWAATFCVLMTILVILYLVARLVFHAWFRTKKHFNEGGKDHGEKS